MFICAFQDGAKQPELCSTPEEFMNALIPFITGLCYCDCNGWNHYLHKSWSKNYCECCRAEKEDILYMSDI
ncbi:MAG: hypothetical protein K2K89_01665 [Ruminococcus sp.]|nr:hypothetical protein [Ruminococcus sp.]